METIWWSVIVSISVCRKCMPEYAVCSTKTLLGIDKYQTNDDGHTQCINQVPALKVCDWTIRYSHISIALLPDRMLFAWNQCMPNSYVPIRNLHLCWSNNNIWAHLTLSLLSPTSRIISSKKKKEVGTLSPLIVVSQWKNWFTKYLFRNELVEGISVTIVAIATLRITSKKP